MDSEQKDRLRDHISGKIETVKKDIVSYKEVTKPIPPDDAIGRLTRMEAINSKSIHEASLRNAENTLKRLERALQMIDTPDFGMCRECGEPIPYGRLTIMPEADMCVRCTENAGG